MFRWARIALTGRRYLGLYGRDEWGWIFHAIVDLDAIAEADLAGAAAMRDYQALAIWRLGGHEAITIDERLPPQVQALHRAAYDHATPEQTIILVLTSAEVAALALPEMR